MTNPHTNTDPNELRFRRVLPTNSVTLTTDALMTIWDENDNALSDFTVSIEYRVTFGQAPSGNTIETYDPGSGDEVELLRTDAAEPWKNQLAEKWIEKNVDYCVEQAREEVKAMADE